MTEGWIAFCYISGNPLDIDSTHTHMVKGELAPELSWYAIPCGTVTSRH